MVIGFDFGTHQSKICIEDRSDRERPVYKFWKFSTPNGDTYALPSVIQINSDDTLTYGFINKSNVKYLPVNAGLEPEKPNIKEPILSFDETKPTLKLPKKPQKNNRDWQEVLRAYMEGRANEEEEWERKCKNLKSEYEKKLLSWESKKSKAYTDYEHKKKEYDKKLADFAKRHSDWEEKRTQKEPAIFRYFKQATFSNAIRWDHEIDKDFLSIWYIANILFDLEKKYGEEFSIQFGFPSDAIQLKNRRQHAYSLLLSAYHLVENVFKGNKEEFLRSSYKDLENNTKKIIPTSEEIYKFGLVALPEAFANLVTVTTQRRIPRGISFVVDIGGGTTDISLFIVDQNDEPHIYGYSSIDKGINYIVETANGSSNVWLQNSLTDLRGCRKDEAIELFRKEVLLTTRNIVKNIYQAFGKVQLSVDRLTYALKNRVVFYTGGGSTYKFLCKRLDTFTDVKKMDEKMWKGFVIDEAQSILGMVPILSTALGLSIQRQEDGDSITVSKTEEIFRHLQGIEFIREREETYGLLDD